MKNPVDEEIREWTDAGFTPPPLEREQQRWQEGYDAALSRDAVSVAEIEAVLDAQLTYTRNKWELVAPETRFRTVQAIHNLIAHRPRLERERVRMMDEETLAHVCARGDTATLHNEIRRLQGQVKPLVEALRQLQPGMAPEPEMVEIDEQGNVVPVHWHEREECHWCDGKGHWFDSAGERNRCEECDCTGKVPREEP